MALMTQVGLEFIARDRSRGQINSFQRNITRMTRSVLQLAGIGGGLYLLRNSLKSVYEATLKQEKAEKLLEAAVGSSIQTYKKFASEIQRVTTYGDEEILTQMAYARNLGVTTEKLKEATKAAVGLAAKYKIDLRSAMMLVGRASQGQTQMLTRYGIVLDENLTVQEKFNELLRLGADAFYLAEAEAATAEGTIKQLSNTWGDLQETIGQQFVPTVTDAFGKLNDFLQEHDRLIKRYIKDFREGIDVAMQIQSLMRQMVKPWWLQGYETYRGIQESRAGRFGGGAGGEFGGRGATGGWEEPIIEPQYEFVGPPIPTDLAERQRQAQQQAERQALADTREYLQSTRHLDYLTRMERIQNLEAYRDAHRDIMYDITGAETEAGKLIRQEIEAIKNSRLDAMQVYAAELREDMQELSLYIAEKWAQTARQIEQSMSNAIYSMIAEGQSFRESMSQLFEDISRAFARMVSEMIARWLIFMMLRGISSVLGPGVGGMAGPSGGGGFGMHYGGIVGVHGTQRFVDPGIFADAPRMHSGGILSDEVPIIAQKGERIIAKGQSPVTNVYNVTIKALDTQDIKRALAKERNFLADLNLDARRKNHPLSKL